MCPKFIGFESFFRSFIWRFFAKRSSPLFPVFLYVCQLFVTFKYRFCTRVVWWIMKSSSSYILRRPKILRNFHRDLSYVVPVKSTEEISQNFVAFSEYMNFKLSEPISVQNYCWLLTLMDAFFKTLYFVYCQTCEGY